MVSKAVDKATEYKKFLWGSIVGGPLIFVLTHYVMAGGKDTQNVVIQESQKDSTFIREQFMAAMKADAVNDAAVIQSNNQVALNLQQASSALVDVAKTNKEMIKRVDRLIGYVVEEEEADNVADTHPN